jgi:hypothetical protein
VASSRAMPLSEEEFTALVDAGCPSCTEKALVVEALVAQKIPLLGGEPYGAPSWGYKGEDLVRGTFLVSCNGCKKELFTATACGQCGADGGVKRALESENAFPLPKACGCGSELLTATAYVPARVMYAGKRAEKARTQTAPEDAGFHAFRVECKDCRTVQERRNPCPLCGTARPG